ncbi:MAG: hypothetical protein K8T25_05690 [Planctomycetia bacterium]|nr:hypothetical protein [Planctomycetia bacterium]
MEKPSHHSNSSGPPVVPSGAPLAAEKTAHLQRRLAFLQLSADDAERLRAMRNDCRQFIVPFVESFYRHLFSFEETAGFLRDPELVLRLKKSQEAHFESMLEAHWNDEYVRDRNRVGQTHAEVGLSPQYFIGAYNQYLQHALRAFAEQGGESAQRYVEQILPLVKVIFLDIGLSLDAYFSQSTQRLREALDMYWKANDDLRRFAQLTSHDLKTPLATVANLCDEVIDEFGDQMPLEAREMIRAARDRTFQNSRMIDELLASTLSLRGDEAVEEVSLADLLAEIFDRLGPAARAKGIELIAGEELPRVWTDKIRLREALYNLVSNAIKFMDMPRGRVEVGAAKRGNEVLLTVADTGPGIPAEYLEQIFVPFRRLPAHRHLPGSGLGLYFTKQLIERGGGRIWVESEPGAGSRFVLLLPARKSNPPHEAE